MDDPALALDVDRPEDYELLARVAMNGVVTYSPKVFIPLTKLCRDVCHYCTFAQPPRRGERAYMTADEVLAVARAGAEAGCHEALFTLGRQARAPLPRGARGAGRARLRDDDRVPGAHGRPRALGGRASSPTSTPGVMTREDLELLRPVSASMGLMLESTSLRLLEKGMPHHGSPDKRPRRGWRRSGSPASWRCRSRPGS